VPATPQAIHAACDERLGPLAAAHTEADNLRTLRAVIETPTQRPESALGAAPGLELGHSP